MGVDFCDIKFPVQIEKKNLISVTSVKFGFDSLDPCLALGNHNSGILFATCYNLQWYSPK